MRAGICLFLLLLMGCASAPQRVVTEDTLGSGDRLRIVITNREIPEMQQVIDTSGDIAVPLAGKLHVAGMTLEKATKTIEAAYWSSGCFSERLGVSLSRL